MSVKDKTAAFFIAWKKPGLPKLGRVVLSIVPIAAPPAIGVAAAILVRLGFDLVVG